MTLRQIYVFQAVMALLLILFMSAAMASRIVTVHAWCKSPDTYLEAIEVFVENGPEAYSAFWDERIITGQCTFLREGGSTYLLVGKVVKRIPKGKDGPEVIISGELITGQTVYIWRDQSDEHLYFDPET